ncbi:MAG: hypothetical protein JXR48_16660 [Candidatus Delongbacteria bacterium]|nr:hypothetical protein [Candidatus Delongbacteria bacterium]MBN2836590.1 hypothetical protein [Candidatus Delongbacteria bacterium]
MDVRKFIFIISGALAGWLFYHFYGCTNGCPISSNPYIMITYGGFSGLILSPKRKKRNEDENNR